MTLTLSLARTAHSSPLGLVAPTRPPTRLDGPAIDRHRSAGNAPIQPRSDVLVVSGPARSGSSPIRYRSPYSCVSREDRSGSRERGFRGICSASLFALHSIHGRTRYRVDASLGSVDAPTRASSASPVALTSQRSPCPRPSAVPRPTSSPTLRAAPSVSDRRGARPAASARYVCPRSPLRSRRVEARQPRLHQLPGSVRCCGRAIAG